MKNFVIIQKYVLKIMKKKLEQINNFKCDGYLSKYRKLVEQSNLGCIV